MVRFAKPNEAFALDALVLAGLLDARGLNVSSQRNPGEILPGFRPPFVHARTRYGPRDGPILARTPRLATGFEESAPDAPARTALGIPSMSKGDDRDLNVTFAGRRPREAPG